MTELSNDVIIAGVREVVDSWITLRGIGLKKQNPGFVIKHLAKLFDNETTAIGKDSQTIGYIRKTYKVYKALSLWDEEGAPDILIDALVEILARESGSNQTNVEVAENNLETEGGEYQQEQQDETQEQTDNHNLDLNGNQEINQVDGSSHANDNDNETEGQVNLLLGSSSSMFVNEPLPFASPSSQDSGATEQLDEQIGGFFTSPSGEDHQHLDLENLTTENSQSLEFEFQLEGEPEVPSGASNSISQFECGSGGVTCPICMITVQSDDHLPAHIRSHLAAFFCQYCKQAFRDSATYQTHMQEMHQSQSQNNNNDNGDNNNIEIMDENPTTTTTTTFPIIESPPDFQVPGPSSSSTITNLSVGESAGAPREMREMRAPKHQCHICHLYLSSVTSLTNHIRVHTGEKPFACSFCGRRFRQTATLNRHISVHETVFSCRHPGCSFSFNSIEERDGHERVPHAILEPEPVQAPTVTYILIE